MDRLHLSVLDSHEDSNERAVCLANSPQVYIYIKYLFIYFMCTFAFSYCIAHALKYCLSLFKGTLLCAEHGCFKGGYDTQFGHHVLFLLRPTWCESFCFFAV